MTAEIVSVGTELMHGHTVDTHAATLGRILSECGLDCRRRQTVGDDWEELLGALRGALERADVVLTIGGLGPTGDDLTREAIAEVLADDLVHEPEVEARLRAFFERRRMPYTKAQTKQSMRPASARLIDNPNGTAPGLVCEKGGKTVVALPGPRQEFGPMAEGPVREHLSRLTGGLVSRSRTIRIVGIGESQVEERISEWMYGENPRVAPYAHPGEVHLRITAWGSTAEEARHLLEPMEAQIRGRLGTAVFGTDDTTLEAAVLELLRARGQTLAVAESLTGGALGARLTSVPGASEAFLGGVIAYTGPAKQRLLAVGSATLDTEGPVSEEAAREMALGVRKRLAADFGVSLTGNAGPTSDVGGKPIGSVYLAVAGPERVVVEEHGFPGSRELVRLRATQAGLDLLRRQLL